MPGVESAALVAPMPFSGAEIGGDFKIEGRAAPEPGREPSANVRNVTSEYFQTIRIPLLKGRYFSEQDQRGDVGAAIVNETFVKRYFANEDPIGKRIKDLGVNQNEGDPKQYEIVGVVGRCASQQFDTSPRRPNSTCHINRTVGPGAISWYARRMIQQRSREVSQTAIRSTDKTLPGDESQASNGGDFGYDFATAVLCVVVWIVWRNRLATDTHRHLQRDLLHGLTSHSRDRDQDGAGRTR